MTFPWRSRIDLPRAAALALVAALVWLAATGKWTAAAWQTPASYSVDALETLGRFQVSHEAGATLLTHPHAARLGAPVGADWTAYPLPDFPWYWLAGKLVGPLGLVPASNVMWLLAHVAAVLAFFGVARVLGQRPLLAAGAALLFGFCFSISHRGLSHHSFALAFTVPLAWLAVWLVAGSRWLVRRWHGLVLGAGLGVALGFSNPYFVYLFGVLLAAATIVGCWRSRAWANFRAALVTGGACVATFALAYAPSLFAAAAGRFGRGAGESSLYGLRWLDLLVPPPNHHFAWFAAWGRNYGVGREGELFAPYLGVLGAVALAALLLGAVTAIARRRWPAPLALWAIGVLAFALSGGVNSWLAALGLDQFRATNRYSVHLLVLALFFLVGWAARHTRNWSRSGRAIAVTGVVAFGLWDQIPQRPAAAHQAALADLAATDLNLGRALEERLPAGAAVFQLPVAVFPEQGPLLGMGDYEHLRLFLGTTTLRFSYGELAASRRLTWQRNVARQPLPAMLALLERAGFSALALHRGGFADGGETLSAALTAAGRPIVAQAGPHVIHRLQPAADARPPASDDPLGFERWDGQPVAPHESAALLGDGWYPLERDAQRTWRWAGAEATLLLHNELPTPRTVRLRGELTATSAAAFTVKNGDIMRRIDLRAYQPQRVEFEFLLAPGLNRVELALAAPARRAGPSDPRQIAFNLADLTADFAPPAVP